MQVVISIDHVLLHQLTPNILITFTDEDFKGVDANQGDTMVVRVIIKNFEV